MVIAVIGGLEAATATEWAAPSNDTDLIFSFAQCQPELLPRQSIFAPLRRSDVEWRLLLMVGIAVSRCRVWEHPAALSSEVIVGVARRDYGEARPAEVARAEAALHVVAALRLRYGHPALRTWLAHLADRFDRAKLFQLAPRR